MSPTPSPRSSCGTPTGHDGFTLIEVLVVSGLLALLLASLVEITSRGAEMFDRGTRGQDLADQATAAMRRVRGAFDAVAGPFPGWRGNGLPEARLIVNQAPLGMRPELAPATETAPARPSPTVQVLRSTIQLEPRREEQLLDVAVRAFVERTEGPSVDDEVIEQHLRTWPRRGRGELLLLPWPIDPAGVFLELRLGERLADPELREEGDLAVIEIGKPEDLALSPQQVLATTRSVMRGLLHFEIEFWSQRTQSWSGSGSHGAQVCWDSARAGLFPPERAGELPLFALDRDPESLFETRDDVWPRWVRVTLVVSSGPNAAPEAFLSDPMTAGDDEMRVNREDALPDLAENPWLKIGSEWVHIGTIDGRRLKGLTRGARGTTAIDHKRGDSVRVGRQVVTVIPLRCGRDADD